MENSRDFAPGELRRQTLDAVAWNVFARFAAFGLQVPLGIVLARLLDPQAVGTVAMITVFTGFATVLSDLGLASVLVQRHTLLPVHISTVFWLNVLAGLTLTIAFILGAPLVAAFYNDAVLAPLTILVSTTFLIGSFHIVPTALLRRHLAFRKLALVDIVALAASGIWSVLLALHGWGVWSLAWQSVIYNVNKTILVWFLSDWRPSLSLQLTAIRDLFSFSSYLLGFSVVNYWLRNADNLIVGRFLGAFALGIYNRAYALMLLPLALISQTVSQVMFPALSTIQTDKPRVAQIYLRSIRMVALITFPVITALFVVCDHFVLFTFGNQWLEMIAPLRIFCVVSIAQSIVTMNGNLYMSQGRTRLQFVVGSMVGSAGVAAIAIGLLGGLMGVAISYAVFVLAATYPTIRIAVSLVDLTFLHVVRTLGSVLVCTAGAGAAMWGLAMILPAGLPHVAHLALVPFFGAVVFIGLIVSLRLEAYQDAREVVRALLPGR